MGRVVVIGAGIVGASIAYRLAQAGTRVDVVDRAGPATGTTGTSFAWLNANAKEPVEYFELNWAGMVEHTRLRDLFASAPWLHHGGMLTWAETPSELNALAEHARWLEERGYPIERWTAGDARTQLEPALAIPDTAIVFFPAEAWVDAPLLARTLLTSPGAGQVRVHTAELAEVDDAATGYQLKFASGETMHADAVVNAAGVGAANVAKLFGRSLPLAPTTGLLVRAAAEPGALHRVLRSPTVHARPHTDRTVLLHHDDIDQRMWDGEDVDHLAADLIRRAATLLPVRERKPGPDDIVVGTRPIPADEFPSLGALATIPGYYEAVTHSGVTLGPLLGRLIADEVLHRGADPLTKPFRADRFTGS